MLDSTTKTPRLAETLKEIGTLDQGTLVSLQVRKKGVERGSKDAKLVYGDDTVNVLIWTGFSYRALIERSQRKLDALMQDGLITKLIQAMHDEGQGRADNTDTCAAIQEVQHWFRRILTDPLAGGAAFSFTEDTEVWEPLRVGGVKVRGSRVYRGPERDTPRAPIPGHIYVQGVKLGEVVVEPAEHGPWTPKSSLKTLTKNRLRSWLPVGLFAQYVLRPDDVGHLQVGKAAGEAAKVAGIQVDPEAVRSLFKIA